MQQQPQLGKSRTRSKYNVYAMAEHVSYLQTNGWFGIRFITSTDESESIESDGGVSNTIFISKSPHLAKYKPPNLIHSIIVQEIWTSKTSKL